MPKGIYLPLDVDFASNKDIAPLRRYGRDARALRDLLVQMWCYCKRHRSDGHVPAEEISLMVYPDTEKVADRDAGRLVEVGIAQRTETGYFLPDYLKHNPSSSQIDAKSELLAESGSRSGKYGNHVKHHENKDVVKPGCPWCDKSGKARVDPTATREPVSGTSSGTSRSETETYPETQTKPSIPKVGGDRHLTSVDGRATFPTHCLDHRYVETPGPCGGCKTAREAAERADKHTTEERTAARVAACNGCDPDGWRLDQHGEATTHRCKHRSTA